ncbi:hypothetical protein PMAYCL1PPCAC_01145, partial [Pristionchus mayeri]
PLDSSMEKSQQPETTVDKSSIATGTDSGVIDDLCRETAILELEDTHKGDQHTEYPSSHSWESLPWPASKRIFFHLRTNEECTDLANLSQVSRHYYSEVHQFMHREDNRPGIKYVHLLKTDNEMKMKIGLYPSNRPFYNLSKLKAGRFTRWGGSVDPMLYVTMNGPADPILEQISDLIASYVNVAQIHGDHFTHDEFSMCFGLMQNSIFGRLVVNIENLDDAIAAHILSLSSHAKEIGVSCVDLQLSDSASFIDQLTPDGCSSFFRHFSSSTSSFFRLPNSFWRKFLNEKLTNGSIGSIKIGNMVGEVTNVPFILPDIPIGWLQCCKKV